jgi:hypothetical protein
MFCYPVSVSEVLSLPEFDFLALFVLVTKSSLLLSSLLETTTSESSSEPRIFLLTFFFLFGETEKCIPQPAVAS